MPRNILQAYNWVKEDTKAAIEIAQGVMTLGVIIVVSCYAFGIKETGLTLLALGIFAFILALVVSFVIDIMSVILSFFSRSIAALFLKIRSVVLSSTAKVVDVLTADWRVTLATSFAIIAGYMITKKLYEYFNAKTPEVDPDSFPKERNTGGTPADT